MKMLKGYPLRKLKVWDYILILATSFIALELLLGFFAPLVLAMIHSGEIPSEQLGSVFDIGIIITNLISVPLMLLVIYLRKVPFINRKNVWSIIPGLSKEDWRFLAWYTPVAC